VKTFSNTLMIAAALAMMAPVTAFAKTYPKVCRDGVLTQHGKILHDRDGNTIPCGAALAPAPVVTAPVAPVAPVAAGAGLGGAALPLAALAVVGVGAGVAIADSNKKSSP
jgi:hypothetical protein